ncbi:MAG TPA: serine hydrolase domain-containing protein [Hyphomicrobium sp.]|nr:serine hydrolase domain-containing protein [Hyphomicrobium sp.]
MTDLDRVLKRAIDAGAAAGVVAAAASRENVFYMGAAGRRRIDEDAPMTTDTIFRIFSMTKAIAGVAAAKLVERGLLNLDAPVADILPEFAELPVLEGFEGDTPILRAPRRQATVRQLATHTSGLVYEFWNADIQKYLAVTGRPGFLSGTKLGISYPLVFDPGERWDYGVGIDWLGLVIEKISGERLDVFCHDEIFAPLGMSDTGFECPAEKRSRLASVHRREEDGSLVPITLDPPSSPEVYGAGYGLYSTARDYTAFLMMLLNEGRANGVQSLKPATVNYILENHIDDLEVVNLVSVNAAVTCDAEFFPGMIKKQSLLTMINMEPARGMRAAGSHCWAGALNTYFWFDPLNGIAGVVLMQTIPFCDPLCTDVLVDFEKAVYARTMAAA